MVTRIVKLHLISAFVEEFKDIFKATKPHILGFEGCIEVELFQDETTPSLFFTISKWHSSKHLDAYRTSLFFTKTWAKIKPNFEEKAAAWSLINN
jgi:quinol monooxygenase YgiN